MRAILFLFCTTLFSFTPNTLFSQNYEIEIDQDKEISVDEIFDLIRKQTDYTFIYQSDLFNKTPKVFLNKGKIKISDLLKKSLSYDDFTFRFSKNGLIHLLKKTIEKNINRLQEEIKGIVTDQHGIPLPGVNIIIKGRQKGVQTDFEGLYSIEAVKGDVLVFSYLGMRTKEISIENDKEINVKLLEDAAILEEVVVTGVPVAISKKKIGYTIASVDESLLQNAPATNIGTALAGKISGINIQPSGTPGEDPQILLRGITSLTSGINAEASKPLIIIDGIIIENDLGTSFESSGFGESSRGIGSSVLSDINLQDVEKIEVVKGAAAASLYGSRAANGVINIITKRGDKIKEGHISVTIRQEYGFEQLIKSRIPKRSKTHSSLTNSDGSLLINFNKIDTRNANSLGRHGTFGDGSGVGRDYSVYQPFLSPDDGISNNPFIENNNQIEDFFTGSDFQTQYISVQGKHRTGNYSTSFEHQNTGGGIRNHKGSQRYNFRLNLDQKMSEKIKLSSSILYSQSETDLRSRRVREVLLMDPEADLFGINQEDGTPFDFNPSAFNFIDRDANLGVLYNPLYVLNNEDNTLKRNRILGNVSGKYNISKGLNFDVKMSYDFWREKEKLFTDIGYLAETNRDGSVGNGTLFRSTREQRSIISSGRLTYVNSFKGFNLRSNLLYQYEQSDNQGFATTGANLGIPGIQSFDNILRFPHTVLDDNGTPTGADDTVTDTFRDIQSFNQENQRIITKSVALGLSVDYKDKIIIDGVIRNDASSLFGDNNRNNIFGRASLAYRLTKDIKIKGIQELKFATSYGTAGTRPLFLDKFDIAQITDGEVSIPSRANNLNLKPSVTRELEFLLETSFLNKFDLQASYSIQNNIDQILEVPLAVTQSGGFSTIRANAGAFSSNNLEFTLNYNALKSKNSILTFGLNFFKGSTKLTEYNGVTQQSGLIRWSREFIGSSLTNFYGNRFAKSPSDLTVNENGYVLFSEDPTGNGLQLTPEDFVVNSEGYVIRTGTENTPRERAELIYSLEDEAPKNDFVLGNSQPDFFMSFITNFNYKGFNFYTLIEHQQGGNILNLGAVDLWDNQLHPVFDQSNRPEGQQKYDVYYNNILNDGDVNSDVFVEDATHLRLREVAIGYKLNKNFLKSIGIKAIEEIEFNIIGRNLFIITDYTGFDPSSGSILSRRGTLNTPAIRTFSSSLSINF
ncbi:SusC/RagA family TonB-linked outer membrane protein [Aquimarina rhabdastrellae]